MTHSPLKARAKLQGQGRTRDTWYPPRKLQEIAGVTDCLIFVYRLQRENDPQHNCSGDAEPDWREEGIRDPTPPTFALTSI